MKPMAYAKKVMLRVLTSFPQDDPSSFSNPGLRAITPLAAPTCTAQLATSTSNNCHHASPTEREYPGSSVALGEVYATAQKCAILNSPSSILSIALVIPHKRRFPMWEAARRGSKESVTREALDRLKAALARIARSKYSSRESLTCSVCHNLIALQTRDICADDNGQTAHADCYVQRVIKDSRPSTQAPA